MDTISVIACIEKNNCIDVRYKWRTNGAKAVKSSGSVSVHLNARYNEDRLILAELSALHHLLCVEQIHGKNRLGNGLKIEVTAGAIRKAVAKGSLKKDDSGRTSKINVAHFSQFLATQFFEAEVETVPSNKWVEEITQEENNYSIQINLPPMASIESPVGNVVISRHALNRFVESFAAVDQITAGATLSDIPNSKWTRAWQILNGLIPTSERVSIPDKEKERIQRCYGKGTVALHHQSSQNVFILKKEWFGATLVTVLRDSDYCKIIPKLPTFDRGRIVPHAVI